jgi:hypothetical protein
VTSRYRIFFTTRPSLSLHPLHSVRYSLFNLPAFHSVLLDFTSFLSGFSPMLPGFHFTLLRIPLRSVRIPIHARRVPLGRSSKIGTIMHLHTLHSVRLPSVAVSCSEAVASLDPLHLTRITTLAVGSAGTLGVSVAVTGATLRPYGTSGGHMGHVSVAATDATSGGHAGQPHAPTRRECASHTDLRPRLVGKSAVVLDGDPLFSFAVQDGLSPHSF